MTNTHRRRSLCFLSLLATATTSLAFNGAAVSPIKTTNKKQLVQQQNQRQRNSMRPLAISSHTLPSLRPPSSSSIRTALYASVQTETTPATSTKTATISPISSTDYVPLSLQSHPSHRLTDSQISPLLTIKKNNKDKLLNAHGLYCLLVIVLTMPFWLASMQIFKYLGDVIEGFDDDRSKFDYTGKVWCRVYLALTDSYPEIAGDVARLKMKSQLEIMESEGNEGEGSVVKENTQACLYVANHASFLDIAVLCTVLDPVFKFIAKDSLKAFPGVGMQLVGGEHVLIDRTNKRSQLKTFKEAITYLKQGMPIMAFPEGERSPDGRLLDFKGGLFSMAVKAKVPIVPLSIANAHAVMPGAGLLPVQTGKGKLRVFVHEPIDVEGKSEEEMVALVREALLRELPMDQHPLEKVLEEVE